MWNNFVNSVFERPHVQSKSPTGNFLATKLFEIVAINFNVLESDNNGFQDIFVITDGFCKLIVF